jgi:hypothetical protein
VNVAYIISAYRLPELLVRLVRRLDGPGTSTFIHVDKKTHDSIYSAMAEPLSARPNVHFLPRHSCYWGDFGHVHATIKGLRALVESGRPFDYVILLTGQDYPLRSNAEIAATLREAAGHVFMDWMPIPNEQWTDGGAYRIDNWHFRVGRKSLSFPGTPFRHALLNAAWSLPARVLSLRRTFPAGLTPYGGSSYWMMPADCARYVDAFTRSRPDFVRFFRHVHVPDEMFFQTIVLNSPFRGRVAASDLRFVDWREDGDHPTVLTSADFERLVQSGALFARKFDPGVDAAVLDRIDSTIAGAERPDGDV